MSHAAYVVPFEKHRFRSAAEHYLKGQAGLRSGFVRTGRTSDQSPIERRPCSISAAVQVRSRSAFAPHAGPVTAIDPEPEMLRIAAASAEAAGRKHPLHRRQLVRSPRRRSARSNWSRSGRAFHWMDRRDNTRANWTG